MSHHAALWSPVADDTTRPPLASDTTTEVCVVGGGISGLTTAYALARTGIKVLLIEADELAAGETARTSAHLASALDDRFHRLARLHGERGAHLAADSHATAISFIEEMTRTHDLACDFQWVPGYLVASDEAGVKEELDDEMVAARRAGLEVASLAQLPLSWFKGGRCLSFSRQAQFHPVRYLLGLARAAEAMGVRIHTGTRAETITGGAHAQVVTTSGVTIGCQHIVVCTNVPINDRLRLHTALEPYRSYCIALRLPEGRAEHALVWDTAEPYHYVRIAPGRHEGLLIVGGEDHKTGQGPDDPEEPYHRLEAWIRGCAPACGEVTHRWSGQIIEPVDGLGLIGHNSFDADNVFVIAGDSGNGLTHGTLGGLLICDLIRGIKNPWEELYRPSRFRLRSAGEFTRHNVNVLGQYSDWFKSADCASIADVAPGTSALVRNGLSKIAVHRDTDGHLHLCSAVCPHLGGLVRWNPSEQTWDCPCHGSRFAIDGAVLNGPANTPLTRVSLEDFSASGERLALQ